MKARETISGPIGQKRSTSTMAPTCTEPTNLSLGRLGFVGLSTALAAMDELDFGEIYINRVGPEEMNGCYTGYRQSGLDGDDGPHGLDAYFRRRTLYLNTEGGGDDRHE
jgi:lactaldehyde dehydrogenase / glycolaldehyde dehydrogenase